MLLIIDNYDSFTYMLTDYFLQLGCRCHVVRNDELTAEEVPQLQPRAIVFSPGPERPATAGNMMAILARYHKTLPMLGICLGHQAMGELCGARLGRAPRIMHGVTSLLYHNHHPLFADLPSPFRVMRYHSLMLYDVEPTGLQIIGWTDQGEVMAIAHASYKFCGIQFHPESIGTEYGLSILSNWLRWVNWGAVGQ